MREIKFRAWDKEDNKMYHTIPIDDMIRHYIPMQFTGLLDKNGKEIYEGDIIFHQKQGKCKVEYGALHRFACFALINELGHKNTLQDSEFLYEIIGNIYENPDLLHNL